jgi:hypothetical protein
MLILTEFIGRFFFKNIELMLFVVGKSKAPSPQARLGGWRKGCNYKHPLFFIISWLQFLFILTQLSLLVKIFTNSI